MPTPSSIVTVFNELYEENASFPIEVTEQGIVTLFNEEKIKNAHFPIVSSPLLRVIASNMTHI